jgi:hypothetical protein
MDQLQRAVVARQAHSDQDWEACKQWWLDMPIEHRLRVQDAICREHKDPYIEAMSRMAQLTLDRLLVEVWPGPQVSDSPPSTPT